MTTPTQEEKRIAISESLGITKIFTLKKRGLFWRHEGHGYTSKESEAWKLTEEEADQRVYPHDEPVTKHRLSTPDYFQSLDACHQAENALTDEQHTDFRIILRDLATPESHHSLRLQKYALRSYVSAGPELRAEALFRVLCRESQACAAGVKESPASPA